MVAGCSVSPSSSSALGPAAFGRQRRRLPLTMTLPKALQKGTCRLLLERLRFDPGPERCSCVYGWLFRSDGWLHGMANPRRDTGDRLVGSTNASSTCRYLRSPSRHSTKQVNFAPIGDDEALR
eukprot:112337-Amphidinium_carterae.1